MRISKITSKSLDFLDTKYKEGGIIQPSKAEFIDTVKQSESYAFKGVKGNVEEVIEQLKSMLKQITALYRDELTVEHIWLQVIAPEQMLFVDYKQIKTVYDEYCDSNNLWANMGVVLEKTCSREIAMSLIFLQGSIDITDRKKSTWDLADLDIPPLLRLTND